MAKWRKRTTTTDAPMGPKAAPTVFTAEEEVVAEAFRPHTLLLLDDCLYALHETIPHLSRSAALLLSTLQGKPPAAKRGEVGRVKEEIQGLSV